MERLNIFIFMLVSTLFSCTNIQQEDNCMTRMAIDFGNLKNIKFSDIITDYSFIQLETLDSSLFGNINQIEIFDKRIYILDSDNTNSILIFSIDGKFITKLEAKGNGPGEFIHPYSFKIEPQGYIYVLDRTINRLLKYRLNNLEFVEEITLPSPAPLSFSPIQGGLFIYYYPIRQKSSFGNKQIVIADKTGKVIRTLYEGPASGKILHGNPDNIYIYDQEIRFYPYFTNRIYKIENDTMSTCYNLFWGKCKMPDESLFEKKIDSNTIMKEILTGKTDWIRLLYVYEMDNSFLVKYYIKRDLYLSYWNKQTQEKCNVKADNIIDDLGFGSPFPLPVGVYNKQVIGIINPYEINKEKVKDNTLRSFLDNITEENNPLLVLYKIQ